MTSAHAGRKRTRSRRSTPARATALNEVFGALSDPTRRAILARLSSGECSVTILSEPFRVSAPAISKHLNVLETAGLIERRKAGRVHYCRMRARALSEARNWIAQQCAFWERQIEALASHLGEPT
jgi:DNA-binding transcriptional ArsR family regulator